MQRGRLRLLRAVPGCGWRGRARVCAKAGALVCAVAVLVPAAGTSDVASPHTYELTLDMAAQGVGLHGGHGTAVVGKQTRARM